MPEQTYSDVIESNPSYSAKLYKARLPYVILAPAIGGLALILCFFLLPWFSIGVPQDAPKIQDAGALMNVPAITIASSGVSLSAFVPNTQGSGGRSVDASFAFPLLWALPFLGLIQLVLAFFVFRDKMLPSWLSLSIRLSFVLAVILEFVYLIFAFFLAFSQAKSGGAQVNTYPASGLWISLLITIIAGFVSLIILPGLSWYWSLARNDLARGIRLSGVQAGRKPAASA
jgi:hypothetical protein